MKIQCDVCEKAAATVICCADEAALCGKCDVEVHAANKLASKHQRLILLQQPPQQQQQLHRCDICQEKTAFIFCVEDRALFCKDCDEPIHSAGTLSANHQRFLATGIRIGFTDDHHQQHNKHNNLEDPPPPKLTTLTYPWADDDLLRFYDFESSQKENVEFEWMMDNMGGVFGDQHDHKKLELALAAAEVPQLPISSSNYNNNNYYYYKSPKSNMPFKKPRIEISDDDDEFFTVPDLG